MSKASEWEPPSRRFSDHGAGRRFVACAAMVLLYVVTLLRATKSQVIPLS
jgi:hypothetical protein